MDSELNLIRPNAHDTEEDLLHMQEKMFDSTLRKHGKSVGKLDGSVDFTRSCVEESYEISKQSGRFCLDLDALLQEQKADVMEIAIQERNIDLLYSFGQPYECSSLINHEDAKDEGFPSVLDLSGYYSGSNNFEKTLLEDGRSLFAMGYDAIHGHKSDKDLDMGESLVCSVTDGSSVLDHVDEEIEMANKKRIEEMSIHEIEKAKQEILERFDPGVIDFLKKRAKKFGQQKAQRILQDEQISKASVSIDGASADVINENENITHKIKELEVFNVKECNQESYCDLETNANAIRLAADVVQLDIAQKCLRAIIPRQQQNILKLFDNLRIPPKNYDGHDDLIEKARANLNAIKGLFLEQEKNESSISVQFAQGINPFVNGSWMLAPLRRVLDVIQKDGKSTAEDLIIVRLSLFWTLLVMVERPTLYHAFAIPNEIFIRLAEVFLMGPEIFKDNDVSQCLRRFLDDYLVPKALDGRLCLILKDPVAGLDAFEPFYHDLLEHFENFSLTDDNFTLFVLLGAYANKSPLDSLCMKCAIWGQRRNIVRQMTTSRDLGAFLLDFMTNNCILDKTDIEEGCFSQYKKLLGMYTTAIVKRIVIKDRNSLVYEIASKELLYFLQKKDTANNSNEDAKKAEHCDAFTLTIQQSLAGFLDY